MTTRAKRSRQLSLMVYGLLFAQQTFDAWLNQAPGLIWALKILPLLIFLPGMLRDNLRSYIWLCFVLTMYFIVLVQRIFAQPQSPVVIVGLISVVVLFTSAMLYVRWRARELNASAQQESTP